MAIEAPAFEDTMETQAPLTPPSFDETSDVEAPSSPPAFDDTSEMQQPVKQGASFGDLIRRIPAGLAEAGANTAAGLTKMWEDAVSIIPAVSPEKEESKKLDKQSMDEVMGFMREVAQRSKSDYGVDPTRNEAFWSQVASGAGSVGPAIASGPFAPLSVAAMMGESERAAAEEKGGTQAQQDTTFYANAAVGVLSEALLGVPALLRSARAAKIPEKTLKEMARLAAIQGLKAGGREGLQEAVEGAAQDTIAKYIAEFDPERNPFDYKKRINEFLVGAVIGGPTGAVVQTAEALSRDVDGVISQVSNEEPPPLPTDAQAIRSDAGQVPATGAIPQESPSQSSSDIQQPSPAEPSGTEVPQPEVPAEGFVGTAIRTPTGVVTGESTGTAHPEMMTQALDEGAPFETMEENLGFAFRKPDGTTEWVDRVEAGRRLTESGQITGLKPGEKLTSEHIRNEVPGVTFNPTLQVTATQAADALQPFFSEAVEVARKSGAADPEAAASQAQIELSNQVEKGKTTLDNPKSLFMEAARRQAGKQKTVETTTEPEAVTTRGPRAETISDEDTRSIDTAINRLPDTQKNIIQKLTEDPTLTDQDIADELGLTIDQVKKGKSAARKTLQSFIQEQGIGLSMGPGAASAAEVLVRYEERKFGKRFQETQEIDPEIQRTTGDRYYEPIPNRVTAEKATELIDRNGEEAIESEIRDPKSNLSFADRNTVGLILMKRFNQQFKSFKDKTSESAKSVLNKAAELAEWAADFGTQLGQGVQSFAMWSRLTAEGKLLTFTRMVDKKRKDYIRSNRGDIDQIKDIINGEGTNPQKVEKIRKLKSKTARKLKSRTGKIIQAAKDGKLTDKKFFDAAGDALGLPVFTPEVAAEILRLANDIDAAPEGMPKMDATLKLNKFLAQQKGFDPSDLLFGVYYGNILSGLQTQGVNFLDTTLNVLNEVGTLALQNPKAAIKIAQGLAKGFATGKADAITSLMHGRRISDGKFVEDPFLMETAEFGKKGGVPIKTDTRAGRVTKRFSESVLGTPLKLYKYIGRAMAASDAFAFRGAQEAKAAQMAYELSNESGQEISQILGYDRIPEFQKQAESEGYTGNQAKARVTELMIMSRPEAIQKASTDFAGDATYNVKPYGLMGSVSNAIEGFTRNYKIGKLVVPFTRIVANVMNRGLNNSPYGYIRALRGEAGVGQAKRVFSPEERNALLIRATVSTVLMSTLVALHESGALTIHGAGPSDPEKKKQLRQSGWKPYTIQIGDTYLNYTLTPWGLAMAATGNWLDNEKYQDFSSKEGADKFAYSIQSVASTMFNQSFLSGLSTAFDVIAGKSPAQQTAAAKRFTANTVSSLAVPFNSAMKDIEAVFSEPNIPRIDSMRQAMIASIPFASQGLQPQLNALGEPVKSSRSRFINFQNDDPVWKLVYEKGLRVPVPNTFFDAPDDQYEYVKQQGQSLRKWMEANLNRLQGMSTEDAQHAIENASNTFRERERNKMIFEGRKKKEKKR